MERRKALNTEEETMDDMLETTPPRFNDSLRRLANGFDTMSFAVFAATQEVTALAKSLQELDIKQPYELYEIG